MVANRTFNFLVISVAVSVYIGPYVDRYTLAVMGAQIVGRISGFKSQEQSLKSEQWLLVWQSVHGMCGMFAQTDWLTV